MLQQQQQVPKDWTYIIIGLFSNGVAMCTASQHMTLQD